jgi:sterol desaturase/sphingolipid hydroxylase (fatty acid hydroxylase superfamily)
MKYRLALGSTLALAMMSGVSFAQSGFEAESVVQRVYGPYAPYVWALVNGLMHLCIIGLVALPFQAFLPGVRRQAKILSYEFWLDIIYWCQGLWLGLISFWAISEWAIAVMYGQSAPWFPALSQLPYLIQVVLAVWAYDFIVYWRHRWEHNVPALWSFHAVHHTTEKVDVLTTTRLHPFELALGSVLNAIVVRLGLDPTAAALGFAIYLHYNFFIHTNVRIRFPGFLKYVLVSPFMHQWHHAKDAAAAGKNLGVVFAWNEWLFGTAYHPDHWPTEFGLGGPPAERVGQSYARHMLYPLQFLYVRGRAWWSRRNRDTLVLP